ncbi:unnamed protein product [Pseudo-nitzschia multistriata]|uniref:Ribosomal protein eL8/eL30/eS12/Gadd45 domain-containing protein n=1 Tax=Pseudo-nitzschia multistriata TaxID=183589 RepID=A0A448Z6B0_9STRA|nr:unnamed protein product [Pseudo-nitzschia multistriata]
MTTNTSTNHNHGRSTGRCFASERARQPPRSHNSNRRLRDRNRSHRTISTLSSGSSFRSDYSGDSTSGSCVSFFTSSTTPAVCFHHPEHATKKKSGSRSGQLQQQQHASVVCSRWETQAPGSDSEGGLKPVRKLSQDGFNDRDSSALLIIRDALWALNSTADGSHGGSTNGRDSGAGRGRVFHSFDDDLEDATEWEAGRPRTSGSASGEAHEHRSPAQETACGGAGAHERPAGTEGRFGALLNQRRRPAEGVRPLARHKTRKARAARIPPPPPARTTPPTPPIAGEPLLPTESSRWEASSSSLSVSQSVSVSSPENTRPSHGPSRPVDYPPPPPLFSFERPLSPPAEGGEAPSDPQGSFRDRRNRHPCPLAGPGETRNQNSNSNTNTNTNTNSNTNTNTNLHHPSVTPPSIPRRRRPKSAKKSKKSDRTSSASAADAATSGKTYEERVAAVSVIAKPLACKKSTKKAHKLVKKAATAKRIRRGVKEVVKGLRKGEGGLCVLAGDIYPLDVYSFLPCLLEEKNVPYIFVPSKQDLGAAACTKRPTSVVLVKDKADKKAGDKKFDGQDLMDTLLKEAREYNPVDGN